MSLKHGLLCGTAAVALAFAAGGTRAQSSPMNTQIQQLRDQIQQLQQQLRSLQTQVNAQAKAVPAAAAAKRGPHATQSGGNQFGLESADGQYSIALTGRLHFDVGTFADYQHSGAAPSSLGDGVNARRARLGVVGKFAGDWNYSFVLDAGGSADATAFIENGYVSYNGFKKVNLPIAVDLGYQDTPYTLDEATSSNNIMFLERSSSQVVATAFGAGDNRAAFGIRSNNDRYWAGLYVTGRTSASAHTASTDTYAAFGRFTYKVLSAPDYSLHFGEGANFDAVAMRTQVNF
jgi:phosphate-selective porin OprO and OprP